ncbi:MAG: DNRLRE domain-containing protein [Candidatus Bathyarchaeota archaeon]|nr:DNRLRE domain-containing protein [Candidatus Bathyarchaeum tardum]
MRGKQLFLIFTLTLLTSFSFSIVNATETFTLNPIADSYVSSNHPTNNYGISVSLAATIIESRIENSYLLFDLTSLDTKTFDITSARLELYSPSDASPTLQVGIHTCQDTTWNENQITWENAPDFQTEPIDLTSISVGNMYYSWDVTQAAKNAQQDYMTLVLTLQSQGENFILFSSKESENYKPQLIVECETTAPPEYELFELNLDVIGSGFTSPTVGTYSYIQGYTVTVTAAADSDWTFSHWILDSVNVGNTTPYNIIINDNHSLTAVFTEVNQEPPQIEKKPPQASFNYTPLNPQVNDTITFDSSSSIDTDGTIVNYSWDFGDGTTSTNQNPTHSYSHEGSYTISLTVTDNDGLSDTLTKNINNVVIPEFSSLMLLPILLMGTLAVITLRKKIGKKP